MAFKVSVIFDSLTVPLSLTTYITVSSLETALLAGNLPPKRGPVITLVK